MLLHADWQGIKVGKPLRQYLVSTNGTLHRRGIISVLDRVGAAAT